MLASNPEVGSSAKISGLPSKTCKKVLPELYVQEVGAGSGMNPQGGGTHRQVYPICIDDLVRRRCTSMASESLFLSPPLRHWSEPPAVPITLSATLISSPC